VNLLVKKRRDCLNNNNNNNVINLGMMPALFIGRMLLVAVRVVFIFAGNKKQIYLIFDDVIL
jgi:hypothetical protein